MDDRTSKFFAWWLSLSIEEIDRIQRMAAVDIAAVGWKAATVSADKFQPVTHNPQEDEFYKRAEAAIGKEKGRHEPVLSGHWRHSNGIISCGTLRIAKADFDTNPHPDFCARVFDDICRTMNKA